MTQSQKEFEAWFARQKDSEYCSENIKSLLSECWTASRAALVVEFPDICDLYPRKILESEVESALDKAGVSYK